jgi:hypothetical protein
LVFFVDSGALGALAATKVAADYDSDRDSDAKPRANVAGGDAHRGADAGAENDSPDDWHRFVHVAFLKNHIPPGVKSALEAILQDLTGTAKSRALP